MHFARLKKKIDAGFFLTNKGRKPKPIHVTSLERVFQCMELVGPLYFIPSKVT